MKNSLLIFLILIANLGFSQIYVNNNATGNNDGTNWVNAYTDLQTAIDAAAAGNEIFVAGGTYKPNSSSGCAGCTNPRDFYFLIDKNITLKGGYNPVTNTQDNTNPSILDGDIGVLGDNSDNTYHVVVVLGASVTTVIDGFTISNGNASGDTTGASNIPVAPYYLATHAWLGGGLYIYEGSVTISNCKFNNNRDNNFGSAIMSYNTSLDIINSVFFENGGGNSQGVVGNFTTSPTITNCTFLANTSSSVIGDIVESSSIIFNTVFFGNTGSDTPGSIVNATSSNNFTDSFGQSGFTLLTADPFTNSTDPDGVDNIIGTADDGLVPALGSPLINAGDNTFNTTSTDITGQARISGPNIDVGAYEVNSCLGLGPIIYVDAAATGNGDGTSWVNAFTSLETALALQTCSNITEIRVASGTYKPSASRDCAACTNPRDYYFLLDTGIVLKGSYDPVTNGQDYTNPSILDGDIGALGNNADNTYHVVVSYGLIAISLQAEIDGFSIINGNANNGPTAATNIPFTNGGSVSGWGAGMYNFNSLLEVTNCSFSMNTATRSGGAIFNRNVSLGMDNTSFSENSAGLEGGGMYNYSSNSIVSNCIFSGNSAFLGGAIGNAELSNLLIFNTILSNNSATTAGALTFFSSSSTITNCIFFGNDGGNINIFDSLPRINNTVLFGNTLGNISQNFIFDAGGSIDDISSANNFSSTSIAQGDFTELTSDPFTNSTDPDGADNIFGTADDGLVPVLGSPLINAGNNTLNSFLTDITGQARISGPNIDVGAYEVQCDPLVAVTNPLTVELLGSFPDSYTLTQADKDAITSGSTGSTLSFLFSQETFTCADIPSVDITVTITDACGSSVDEVVTITVEDNRATGPICINGLTFTLDASGTATILPEDFIASPVTDNCGGTITYTLSQDTFDCSNLGINLIQVFATDENGNSDFCETNLFINDPLLACNTAPTAVCQALIVEANANCEGIAIAESFDGGSTDAQDQDLTFTVSPVGPYPLGVTNVTLTVSDGELSSSCDTTITVNDTIPPNIGCIAEITVQLDASGNATITGEDIVVPYTVSDACGAWVYDIDITNFTCADIGGNVVSVTVTDGAGNSTQPCFSIVTVVDSIAPTVATQDITVQLDASGNASIAENAVDNGSTDVCGGLTFDTDITTFTCADVGTNTVTLSVTDASGNTDTGTAVVTVVDSIAPAVVTQDITVQLDATGNVSIAENAVDNGSTDACGGLTFDTDITTFTCADVGANTVTLSVTDAGGNTNTGTAIVTVQDITPPTVVTQDITVQLDATGNVSIAENAVDNGSTDACGGLTFDTDITTFSCADVGTNTVILSVTDASGNTDTGTAVVTVVDSIAPAVVTQDITVQLDATGNASIAENAVDNGSTDACGGLTFDTDTTTFTCADVGANTVTLSVTDASGNTNTGTAIVTVQDTTAPTVVTQDITVQLDASGNTSIAENAVDNGSTDACGGLTFDTDVTAFTCANLGTNTVTLSVSDSTGNTNTGTATVTVVDSIAPTIITQDITVQLNTMGSAMIMPSDIDNGSTDNCNLTLSIDMNTFDCSDVGNPTTVTLTGVDASGNSSSQTATVTVVDNILPNVITQDATIALDSNGQASIAVNDIDAGSTDNCGIASRAINITTVNCPKLNEVITVILTVTDVNGNTNTATAQVGFTGPDEDIDGITDACDASFDPNFGVILGISPNGDGQNDTWFIDRIDQFPNALIQVFERSGREVFKTTNYQNNWSGNRDGNGDLLPIGSYYYVITLNGQRETSISRGWIYINY